ncbi:MAG: hypothetical protein PHO07_15500, partial [Pirellulales bacterium]|nr:hypothetical protein [Pirellulales bacterium]
MFGDPDGLQEVYGPTLSSGPKTSQPSRGGFVLAPGGGVKYIDSFASETPVTDGERVYAYFGN